ncbi:hypothetical protein LF1_50680 [Rubripirellula obstinata]|uniref:Uncharacterized protein n=1 Tax=Rubripirellula obstinata TaxID=406547 RepID=A0A5B1CML2_9BACT|nr:hypothetical protein [Rubripirellula obstinata]KAA1257620.1 hypothetical protein LF1_01080 [Rubripirellula obstinata]KAA1258493.1 hypothetical protein LF1_10130 [Rubripirellula obstinata]KAA1260113.1 hypothetical protein LF1_26520 [Rubripirellula obstinata]KAA1260410.1 hypothetical protein LF1_29500 [Rubripirellula obstinata]KAA1260790.1 hypothetical protein LF1_33320 [Rubripirellula obstinata]
MHAIRLVTVGALSLRAASRALSIADQSKGLTGLDTPCQTTIQNHLLRIGLYLIERGDQVRSDWIWLMDHFVNAGSQKCLVVLGISLAHFQKLNRPLAYSDLTVIAIIPVDQSNGEIVRDQLQQTSDQFGVPLATLSDRGSDLKKGCELFQVQHPEVISLYDIVHLVSRIIKSIFEADPRWEAYPKACCTCANFLRQSVLAHLKPPTPKTKARYMNYDREVRWAARALWLLDRTVCGKLSDRQKARLPRDMMLKRLGWLRSYRSSISTWLEVILVGQAICQIVRREGYHRNTAASVLELLTKTHNPSCRNLIQQSAEQIEATCQALPEAQSFPGSTEVLESVIGKGKRLLHHNNTSLTRQVLAIATTTATITIDLVQTALSTCRMKHLRAWVADSLTPGIHVAREEDLGLSQTEQNLRNRLAAATPNF